MASIPNPDPMRELFDAGVTDVDEPSDTKQAAGLAGLMVLLAGLWAVVGATVIAILVPIVVLTGVYFLFSSGGAVHR